MHISCINNLKVIAGGTQDSKLSHTLHNSLDLRNGWPLKGRFNKSRSVFLLCIPSDRSNYQRARAKGKSMSDHETPDSGPSKKTATKKILKRKQPEATKFFTECQKEHENSLKCELKSCQVQ